MAILYNNFNGGTDGTAITTGNSGGSSGNNFSFVNTTGVPEFDTAFAAHGGVSGRFIAGSATDNPYVRWTTGVSNTTVYGRAYVYIEALPSASTNIARFISGSSTVIATVRVNTTGKLAFLYGSGTLGGTSTNSVNVGSWFRLEMQVTASTTAGAVQVWLYNSMDSASATESLSVSGVNTGADTAVDNYRCGIVTASAIWAVNIDDMAFGDSGLFGPASVSANAGLASIAAVAPSPTPSISCVPDVSLVAGNAPMPSALVGANAGIAAAEGRAYDAAVSLFSLGRLPEATAGRAGGPQATPGAAPLATFTAATGREGPG